MTVTAAPPARATDTPPVPPLAFRSVVLPSEKPTGDPTVDAIEVAFYPASESAADKRPAVVILGLLSEDADDPQLRAQAAFAVRNGISAAIVTLPYHGRRKATGESKAAPALHFLDGDARVAARIFDQSAADVSTVVSWLLARPGVDPRRIGVQGVSLGAIIAHLAMGRDPRIGSGVAMLGGGRLADLGRRSFFARAIRLLHPSRRVPPGLTADEIERALAPGDPLTYADRNRPRRVFMIQAARDAVIPPDLAERLWEALGRPPIRWVDANHYGLRFARREATDAALAYFRHVWSENPAPFDPPELPVPTIKLGLFAEPRRGLTPALTYQVARIGNRRDHLSVAHADVGIGTRGPFAAAGLTLGTYADAGFLVRPGERGLRPRPYLSFSLTF